MGQKLSSLQKEDPPEQPQKYSFNPETNQIIDTTDLKKNAESKSSSKFDSRKIYQLVSTGLRSDLYLEESKIKKIKQYSNVDSKKILLRNHANQPPSRVTLQTIYPFTSIDHESRDNSRKWNPLKMPTEFGYTCAIVQNFPSQGLLHSFLRHWPDWIEQNILPESLEPIQKNLKFISDAPTEEKTKEELNNFTKFMEKLKKKQRSKFDAIDSALLAEQVKVHQYLTEQATYDNYLGDAVSDYGDMQVLFKVKHNKVILMGISNQLYPKIDHFDDPRPVRSISNVTFITRERYSKWILGKTWVPSIFDALPS